MPTPVLLYQCLQASLGSQLELHCYIHVTWLTLHSDIPNVPYLYKMQKFPIYICLSMPLLHCISITTCSFSPNTTPASTCSLRQGSLRYWLITSQYLYVNTVCQEWWCWRADAVSCCCNKHFNRELSVSVCVCQAQYIFLHQSTLELLNNKGNSQSIWFVSYSALEKMDSLDAMEGKQQLANTLK